MAISAADKIIAATSPQGVVAAVALEQVGAVAADQLVLAGAADERVVAAVAVELGGLGDVGGQREPVGLVAKAPFSWTLLEVVATRYRLGSLG